LNSDRLKDGLTRYDRQLELLGKSGQENLNNSSVAVVGLGGLGSPATIYLAIAGLGKLVLVDHDEVVLSNLNRQFLHWDEDLGRQKSRSAAEKLKRVNSEISVETLELELTANTAGELSDIDLVIGAVDNFETRYLLNELAVDRGIPYIHGAVEGFRGQLTTVVPGETPCLRCIFPDEPPDRSGIQVLGVTAGVIGTMMANEAIKVLTDRGNLVTGRLLMADLASGEFDSVDVHRNRDCPVCGK